MAVNKVIYGGVTLVDMTEITVTEDTLLEGTSALDKSGQAIAGKVKPVSPLSGEEVAEIFGGTSAELEEDRYLGPSGVKEVKKYVDGRDPFMLLDFRQDVTGGVLLPVTSTTAISGASTGRVDITVPEQYQADWALASIAKWELKNGSTRVDAFPMYQFSMNGQKTMRVGYRTSGTDSKAFTSVSGAMLLKHR